MPTQQRSRSDQEHAPRGAWQVAARRRQQRPINDPELRPHDLAAQDLELVPQHQQLDVLHVQAAAATQQRAEQRP